MRMVVFGFGCLMKIGYGVEKVFGPSFGRSRVQVGFTLSIPPVSDTFTTTLWKVFAKKVQELFDTKLSKADLFCVFPEVLKCVIFPLFFREKMNHKINRI